MIWNFQIYFHVCAFLFLLMICQLLHGDYIYTSYVGTMGARQMAKQVYNDRFMVICNDKYSIVRKPTYNYTRIYIYTYIHTYIHTCTITITYNWAGHNLVVEASLVGLQFFLIQEQSFACCCIMTSGGNLLPILPRPKNHISRKKGICGFLSYYACFYSSCGFIAKLS